jgi:hypothetical protein
MNDHYDFTHNSSGYDAFSMFDVGLSGGDCGQTLSFPDYIYGTIQEVSMEGSSTFIIKMRTVDGPSEIRVVPSTNFIGCLREDMSCGCKAAIAISRDAGGVTATKIMMFSGG